MIDQSFLKINKIIIIYFITVAHINSIALKALETPVIWATKVLPTEVN